MAPDQDDLFRSHNQALNAGIGSWANVPEAIHVPTSMSVKCVVDQKAKAKAKVKEKEKGKANPLEDEPGCLQEGHAIAQTDLQEDASGKHVLQKEQGRLHEERDIPLHQGHH